MHSRAKGAKLDSSRLSVNSEHGNKSHKWLIALIAILVAAAAAFLMMRSCDHQAEPMKTQVNVQPAPEPADNDAPSWKIERHHSTKEVTDSDKTGL